MSLPFCMSDNRQHCILVSKIWYFENFFVYLSSLYQQARTIVQIALQLPLRAQIRRGLPKQIEQASEIMDTQNKFVALEAKAEELGPWLLL